MLTSQTSYTFLGQLNQLDILAQVTITFFCNHLCYAVGPYTSVYYRFKKESKKKNKLKKKTQRITVTFSINRINRLHRIVLWKGDM